MFVGKKELYHVTRSVRNGKVRQKSKKKKNWLNTRKQSTKTLWLFFLLFFIVTAVIMIVNVHTFPITNYGDHIITIIINTRSFVCGSKNIRPIYFCQ